ncbi:hypothetical protein [Mucilaginibacter kameinonensis]|uniref:hypothetical protein n=1 Tax=Mucilaginibacter kameinonensis TaxID=452286 RepID=UPI000EF80801|nr:hypothetical protein [Mucilaginibacter kameinonensis]
MLKSELIILEQQVTEIITDHKQRNGLAPGEEFSGEVKSVLETCTRLKKHWIQDLFGPAKDYAVNRYVKYHQSGITRLSDAVSEAAGLKDPASLSLYDGALGELLNGFEDLLLFLQNNCYQFFDSGFRMTVFNERRQYNDAAGFEKELRAYKGPAMETGLAAAIADSVSGKLQGAACEGISYRDAELLTQLTHIVRQHLNNGNENIAESLQDALYRQNLNTRYFYHWYTGAILSKMAGAAGKKGKEQLIMEELTRFSGVFVRPGNAFEPGLPAIDQQVGAFLKAQLGHPSRAAAPGGLNGNSRLAIDLSVPQFAIFVRVLYQCGCFPVRNVAKIVRFFTAHFTTKKQSDVSAKSFARAFYGMDQPAAAVVRDILRRMIDYIDKIYFP